MSTQLQMSLPESWSFGVTQDGRIFFINDEIRATTWLHPVTRLPLATGLQRVEDLPPGWERGLSSEGVPYYINHNKQETTLVHPITKENTLQTQIVHQQPQAVILDSADSPKPVNANMETKRTTPKKKTPNPNVRSPIVKRNNQAPVTIQGWLWKQGSDGFMRWKKRWFVLTEFCLFYYNAPEEEKVLGSILLPSYEISPCGNESKVNRKFAFKLEHQNMRTYYLAAETKESYQQWMNALTLASLLQREANRDERHETILRPDGQYGQSGTEDEDSGFTSYHSRRYVGSPSQNGNSPHNGSFSSDCVRMRPEDMYHDIPHNDRSGINEMHLSNNEKYPNTYMAHPIHRPPQNGNPMYPPPKPKRMTALNPEAQMINYGSPQYNQYGPYQDYPQQQGYPQDMPPPRVKPQEWGPQINYGYSPGDYMSPPRMNPMEQMDSPRSMNYPMEQHQMSPRRIDYRDQYDPAVLREKGHKLYHAQRPHSANFLEHDFEPEEELIRNVPVMRSQRVKGNRAVMRPKSSGEQYNVPEYWDEGVMNDVYQSHQPPHTPHTPHPNVWEVQRNPDTSYDSYESSQDQIQQGEKDGERSMGNAQYRSMPGNDAQFIRSASARLASENSGYSREAEGEEPKHAQQREESMKRLLEWKQRMLQSPLTKKYPQQKVPPTRNVATTPKKMVEYRKGLNDQVDSMDNYRKPEEMEVKRNLIPRVIDNKQLGGTLHRYRMSYSSDDEDDSVRDLRKRMSRRSSQAGRTRKVEKPLENTAKISDKNTYQNDSSDYVNINAITMEMERTQRVNESPKKFKDESVQTPFPLDILYRPPSSHDGKYSDSGYETLPVVRSKNDDSDGCERSVMPLFLKAKSKPLYEICYNVDNCQDLYKNNVNLYDRPPSCPDVVVETEINCRPVSHSALYEKHIQMKQTGKPESNSETIDEILNKDTKVLKKKEDEKLAREFEAKKDDEKRPKESDVEKVGFGVDGNKHEGGDKVVEADRKIQSWDNKLTENKLQDKARICVEDSGNDPEMAFKLRHEMTGLYFLQDRPMSSRMEKMEEIRRRKEVPPKNIVQDRIRIFEAASVEKSKPNVDLIKSLTDSRCGLRRSIGSCPQLDTLLKNEKSAEEYYIPMKSGFKSWLYDKGVDHLDEAIYVQMDDQGLLIKSSNVKSENDATDVYLKLAEDETSESLYDLAYKTDYEPIYAELKHPETKLLRTTLSDDQPREVKTTGTAATSVALYENLGTMNLDTNSGASDADDEGSKDFECGKRFSMSDSFRPASYYLKYPKLEHQSGSSDEDLTSPPPIPQSPPPIDDFENWSANQDTKKWLTSETTAMYFESEKLESGSFYDAPLNYSYYRVYEDDPKYMELETSCLSYKKTGEETGARPKEISPNSGNDDSNNSAPYYYSDLFPHGEALNFISPERFLRTRSLLNNSRDVNVNKREDIGRKVNLINNPNKYNPTENIVDELTHSINILESKQTTTADKNTYESDTLKMQKHKVTWECRNLYPVGIRDKNRRSRSLEDLLESENIASNVSEIGAVVTTRLTDFDWLERRRMSRSLDEIDREELRRWDMMSTAPLISRLLSWSGVNVYPKTLNESYHSC